MLVDGEPMITRSRACTTDKMQTFQMAYRIPSFSLACQATPNLPRLTGRAESKRALYDSAGRSAVYAAERTGRSQGSPFRSGYAAPRARTGWSNFWYQQQQYNTHGELREPGAGRSLPIVWKIREDFRLCQWSLLAFHQTYPQSKGAASTCAACMRVPKR